MLRRNCLFSPWAVLFFAFDRPLACAYIKGLQMVLGLALFLCQKVVGTQNGIAVNKLGVLLVHCNICLRHDFSMPWFARKSSLPKPLYGSCRVMFFYGFIHFFCKFFAGRELGQKHNLNAMGIIAVFFS